MKREYIKQRKDNNKEQNSIKAIINKFEGINRERSIGNRSI